MERRLLADGVMVDDGGGLGPFAALLGALKRFGSGGIDGEGFLAWGGDSSRWGWLENHMRALIMSDSR